MKINNESKLFLRDVYLYDISACHYNIMKKFGFDMTNIDIEDKEKRNIEIGKMMGQNPRLTSLLRTTTESVIDEYLHRNNISDSDVIVRAYDGIVVTKLLRDTDKFLDLKLKDQYQTFIISIQRNSYLALGNKVEIKGVSHRYVEMDKVFERILKINYTNKPSIFISLQSIKDEILNSDDSSLYCIPSSDEKCNVIFNEYGQVELSSSLSNMLDCSDINREWYFNKYIRPFTESITFEFLKGDER